MRDFWLGVHRPGWLSRYAVPMFVSHRLLAGRRTLPRALGPWALDSGAFSEIRLFGHFQTSTRDYAKAVRRYAEEIGQLQWAAIQDWMCEPFMLQRTGLTVAEHQRRTVENYDELLGLEPSLPWVPVLQGYRAQEYEQHVAMYEAVGLPIRDRLVGVGSVCRRQDMAEAVAIVKTVALAHGLRLHGFGIKTRGLLAMAPFLESTDSMAWSFRARKLGQRVGHPHVNCANCPAFALAWREQLLTSIAPANAQLALGTPRP